MIPEAENYRKELNTLGYGRPVYDPDPGDYDRARIGDVGYFVPLGGFCRLFNVLYSENDVINRDGVPFGFVPMDEQYRQWRPSQPIPPGVICRSRVKRIGGDFEINNGVLPVGANFALSSSERHWAALIISRHAIRKDTKSGGAFKDYIIKHHQSWLAFARDTKRIEISLKDIVLVTGLDMTHEWATASAVEWNREWEVSFDVKSPGSGRLAASAWCSWTSSVSLPLRFGPIRHSSLRVSDANAAAGPSNLTQPNSLMFIDNADSQTDDDDEPDQCVFMRGYRVIPRPPLPPRIKAAAEPKDENEGEDDKGETYPQMVVASIGLDSDDDIDSEMGVVESQNDTFKASLDYIFNNSDADFAVLHDDDVHKFNTMYDHNEARSASPDVKYESWMDDPQEAYIILESINGVKAASLGFRPFGRWLNSEHEDIKAGILSKANDALTTENTFKFKFDGLPESRPYNKSGDLPAYDPASTSAFFEAGASTSSSQWPSQWTALEDSRTGTKKNGWPCSECRTHHRRCDGAPEEGKPCSHCRRRRLICTPPSKQLTSKRKNRVQHSGGSEKRAGVGNIRFEPI